MSTGASAQNIPNADNEYEALMQKIRLDFAKNPSIDKDLKTYNEADGSFTDVDYASIERTNWPPMKHIDRLSDFAFAYTNPQNKYYKDKICLLKFKKGWNTGMNATRGATIGGTIK
jgi:chondroitin AC lyase